MWQAAQAAWAWRPVSAKRVSRSWSKRTLRNDYGVALSGDRQPAMSGTVARPLADPSARRDVMLAAVAGRPQGPGPAAFLKLMRARDWSSAPTGRRVAAGASKP